MKDELVNNGRISMLFPLLAGGILGAGLGLLFAPKSGRETRNDIRDLAARTRERVGKTIDDGVHVYEKSKRAVANAIDCGTEAFAEKREQHLKSA
jgi:gas vesicle protein